MRKKLLSIGLLALLLALMLSFAQAALAEEIAPKAAYTSGSTVTLTGKLSIKGSVAILKLEEPADFKAIPVLSGGVKDFLGAKDIQVMLSSYKKNNGKTVKVKGTLKGRKDQTSAYTRDYVLEAKTVTVIPDVKKVTLNKKSAQMNVGATLTLKASVAPKGANTAITWSSNKTSIATVDSKGKVTALKGGKATITAKSKNGKTAKATITIVAKVKSVELSASAITLKKGNTQTLKATIIPADAANKKVTWKSSKTSVATVDSKGKVKAIKNGTAKITVTTADGKKKATCTVTVSDTPAAPSTPATALKPEDLQLIMPGSKKVTLASTPAEVKALFPGLATNLRGWGNPEVYDEYSSDELSFVFKKADKKLASMWSSQEGTEIARGITVGKSTTANVLAAFGTGGTVTPLDSWTDISYTVNVQGVVWEVNFGFSENVLYSIQIML